MIECEALLRIPFKIVVVKIHFASCDESFSSSSERVMLEEIIERGRRLCDTRETCKKYPQAGGDWLLSGPKKEAT